MEQPPRMQCLPVETLLFQPSLHIPDYQRPYKWTTKNVRQLMGDIVAHKDKSAYCLGTVVLHEGRKGGGETKAQYIVDGQQRIVTLLLIIQAFSRHNERYFDRETKRGIAQACDRFTFSHVISQNNIRNNYNDILRAMALSGFDDQCMTFLLKKCTVNCFILSDIAEAFQFFDSQNARGKVLAPHDLLKAYHLRAFPEKADADMKARSTAWEKHSSDALHTLFALYMYRIRRWVLGESACYFSKDDVDMFKGIDMDPTAPAAPFPHAQTLHMLYRMHHFFNVPFPFQLDQNIINGSCFFEMVQHYMDRHGNISCDAVFKDVREDASRAKRIWTTLDTYEGRCRTGDGHVRSLFNALLLYYMDKFGNAQLCRAVERIFVWAYALRWQSKRVSVESVNKYVLDNALFAKLKAALRPEDFFVHEPEVKKPEGEPVAHLKEIEDWLKTLGVAV